ncbi:MAG: flagellin lysine-N-methylase [Gammaproteobacteria bacterium]
MKKQFLELSARQNFTCLGSDCPRDCCHEWDKIVIDKDTLEKWDATKDDKTKKLLMSHVDSSNDGTPILKMSDDKVCTALENGLCSIQLQLGHEYLSETCRTFPRVSFHNNYRNYDSALFSCPAIVDSVLFSSSDKPLFSVLDTGEKNEQTVNDYSNLLFSLDTFLTAIIDRTKYPLGITLFFVSDVFANIIKMIQTGQFTDQTMQELNQNIDTYLTDISKAVKHGKLGPNPVTSGSFWKSIYELCESHNINQVYLGDESDYFIKEIKGCDGSFASYTKIYSHVKKYSKKANKQIKHQYIPLLRKFIQLTFVNKGFPLAPNNTLNKVLVDCFMTISVFQLLLWFEVNKNGKLTDKFIRDCVVEVDRKFALHDGVIKGLEEDPHMIQIEKYCNSFLDLF